jgi:hypothetical protein
VLFKFIISPLPYAATAAAILSINIAKATEGTDAKADWPLNSLPESVTVAKLPLPVRSTVTAKFSVMTVSVSNLLRLSKFMVAWFLFFSLFRLTRRYY